MRRKRSGDEGFADHAAKLRAAKVLIEREERKTIILEQAQEALRREGAGTG